MKKLFAGLMLVFGLQVMAVNPGEEAPKFKLKDENGKEISLSDFKDKIVILEWLNHGCPFVRKHYDSGNIPNLQKKYAEKDVVWLSIISSVEGKQGHSTPEVAKMDKKKYNSNAAHILLDTTGEIGKLYGAITTPHIYIIGKDSKIQYQGAIDSINSTNIKDIEKASNYVTENLDLVLSGQAVKLAKTKPYGCTIKY